MSIKFFSLSSAGSLRTIRDNPTIAKINTFMRSPLYIIILAVLTAISNLFSLDLWLYSFFILVSIFIALFGTDFLALIPIVILCYIAPSPSNNPGSASNSGSIFYPENGGIYLIVLASLFLVCLLFRLVTDQKLGGRGFLSKPRALIRGMLVLCGAYLLSGVGMSEYGASSWKVLLFGFAVILVIYAIRFAGKAISHPELSPRSFAFDKNLIAVSVAALLIVYGISGGVLGMLGDLPSRNLLFALIQCVSVVGLYYLFTGTIRWGQAPKSYLAWVGMCVGFVVLIQLMENYFSGRIFIEGTNTIDREYIYAGWGMHNNIGGMMAFMLPFPFYLACTSKRSWVYNILGTVLLLGVIASCSRTSILVAFVIYGCCLFLLLRRKDARKENLTVCAVIGGIVLLLCVVFFRKLMDVFALFFKELFIMSERDNLVGYGMKQYLSNPIFGGSFFPQGEYVPWDWSTSDSFSSFFPPRWHNTIIQMLASCGIVGFVSYAYHRYQTVKLMLKDRSIEKIFIGLYMLSLVACSLMDCHFFNVGPVLFYSMALAYGENIHQSTI